MKLLLDENLPIPFRHFIAGHECFTAEFMGWKGLKNGQLLSAAAAEGFSALLTTDQHMADQQNLATQPVALVILRAPSNKLEDLRPLVGRLLDALDSIPRQRFVFVGP